MPSHSPTYAPNGGFAGDVASVCDTEHPPHTGRIWAVTAGESELIHYNKIDELLLHGRAHAQVNKDYLQIGFSS